MSNIPESQDNLERRTIPANDEPDHLLDAALAKYVTEPRAGLEERVLANLGAKRGRVTNRAWWRGGLAGTVAVVFAVAVALAWRSGKPWESVIANHPSVVTTSPKAPAVAIDASIAAISEKNSVCPREGGAIHRSAHSSLPVPVSVTAPKLDQFPSPQPLSEQEKILESYVENYPEHAALLARARTEALRRDQLEEMQAIPSSGWISDSEEPNNDNTNQ